MNGMAKTIDDKIDHIKHEGIINIPQQNTLENLPRIESLVFETKPYKLFADDAEPIDVLLEWANDGGSVNWDS